MSEEKSDKISDVLNKGGYRQKSLKDANEKLQQYA